MPLSELLKEADWKKEKHVPVIDAPESVKADEMFEVTVSLGKEVAHPNKTEHHIRWISLYFLPDGASVPFQVAHTDFCAHGESADGANEGDTYTHHGSTVSMKTGKSGKLLAESYCNIHGLWQSEKEIKVS